MPDVLLSHLPPDPRELATGSSTTISIKNLTQRHRGEVRELSSSAYWSPWVGKVPVSACHPQLIGLITQWQPASGGSEPASDSRQRHSAERWHSPVLSWQPASGGSEPAGDEDNGRDSGGASEKVKVCYIEECYMMIKKVIAFVSKDDKGRLNDAIMRLFSSLKGCPTRVNTIEQAL